MFKYRPDDFTPYDADGNSIYDKPNPQGLSYEEVDQIYLNREDHEAYPLKDVRKLWQITAGLRFRQIMGRYVSYGPGGAIRMRKA